ncbi:MAG: hypothetical protein WD407_01350 [Rhodospirillales bacterium]
MRVWLSVLVFAGLLVTPALANAQSGTNEQSGRSGQPLSVFCNVAPELSTQRSDSVDNWVRICSLWLPYNCQAKGAAPGGKKVRFDPSAPGFRLIGSAPAPVSVPGPGPDPDGAALP